MTDLRFFFVGNSHFRLDFEARTAESTETIKLPLLITFFFFGLLENHVKCALMHTAKREERREKIAKQ